MNRAPIDRRSFCLGAVGVLIGLGSDTAQSPAEIKTGVGSSLRGARPFPDADPWNRDISRSPVDPASDVLIKSIGLDKPLHADFGTVYQGRPIGIPYVVVARDQPRVPVQFDCPEESDPGPYPIPPDVPIEGGLNAPADSDRHVLMIDRDEWKLYELFGVHRGPDGWRAGSGAIFDLRNNTTRPAEWTSADAAGLPIFPGLVRPDEVLDAGLIRHALRFTCRKVRRAYVAPARHYVNREKSPALPPLGLRVRLKPGFDTRTFPKPARVILDAMKTYGMILADVGSDWFVSGSPDKRWADDDLGSLRRVTGKHFEVIKMPSIVIGA